jgi:hypothetical protein
VAVSFIRKPPRDRPLSGAGRYCLLTVRTRLIAEESEKWGKVVLAANIKA